MAALNEKQRYELRKFIKELESFRGRHTELVSVYIPQGYDLNAIINHLSQEQGTASNIKSKQTRENVQGALEKMIQHLRLFKKTPDHGLAIFSGNVTEREGQEDFKVWSIEPPVPLQFRTYRCDKEFLLEPLREMIDTGEEYGLVVLDRRDAMLAILKGKTIIPIRKTHSEVPGKFKAGGQCIVPDSIVQLSDGSLPKVEIVHNPNVVKSVMIKNKYAMRNSNITDKWNVKKKSVYKIVTKSPRLEVRSSGDHLFFVATKEGIIEKPAEELKEGDFLIMPEKIDVKSIRHKIDSKKYYNSFIISKKGQKLLKQKRLEKKLLQKQLAKKARVTQTTISSYELGKINANKEPLQRICKELDINFKEFLKKYTDQRHHQNSEVKLPAGIGTDFAQFLGYLIGDGCIETDRITFFEQDKQVALSYQNKFNKFFNINSSYKFRSGKNYHQLRFTSRPLVRLVREEFPEIKKAANSGIPKKILQSKNKVVALFLKGLFDAEGYIHSKRGIGLGINNKRLAHQIQMTLLRFSILSSLHEYDNRANKYSKNPRFTIDISERKSIELFKKSIGFTSSKKKIRIQKLLKNKTNRSNVRQIIVPGTKIRAIIEKAGYNTQLFPKVNSFFRDEKMMGKDVFMKSIICKVKDKKLRARLGEIHKYPILPVKISSIKKSNKATDMIDISVKNQNFIANGLLVHNSAQRFARLREGAAKEHFKKIAEHMKDEFLNRENLKGIIIGGPGTTVSDFMIKDYLTGDLKKKIIGTKDLSYTGEFGLQELLDKSQDLLAAEDIAKEKKLMAKFFNYLATKPKMVSYGKDEVMRLLKMGAVDQVLLSEDCEDAIMEEFEEAASEMGTTIEIISVETREGVQLRDMGKIAAILRYEV